MLAGEYHVMVGTKQCNVTNLMFQNTKYKFFEFIFVTQVYNEKRFYIITQSFSESKSSLFERGLKLFLGLYC